MSDRSSGWLRAHSMELSGVPGLEPSDWERQLTAVADLAIASRILRRCPDVGDRFRWIDDVFASYVSLRPELATLVESEPRSFPGHALLWDGIRSTHASAQQWWTRRELDVMSAWVDRQPPADATAVRIAAGYAYAMFVATGAPEFLARIEDYLRYSHEEVRNTSIADSGYLLTHLVLYSTDLGRRDVEVNWIPHELAIALRRARDAELVDLYAELLVAMWCAGMRVDDHHLEWLSQWEASDGAYRGGRLEACRPSGRGGCEFWTHYHRTLMALLASGGTDCSDGVGSE